MSDTPNDKILVPTNMLSQLLRACLGPAHVMRELVATLDLPDLKSLRPIPNPLKVLLNTYNEYADNNFINQTPVTVYFFMEEDETLHLSSCHIEITGAIEHYKNSISDGSLPKGWKIVKAQIVFETALSINENAEETVESKITDQSDEGSETTDRIAKIGDLASKSTFYQIDGHTYRIDSCEIEEGTFYCSDENSGHTRRMLINSVKDSDVFILPNPIAVSDYLKSNV